MTTLNALTTHIAILAKAPIAGSVKTRLIPALGAEGAAELQRKMLWRCVQTAIAAKPVAVHLWCSPTTDHLEFMKLADRFNLTLHRQQGDDLGCRMHAAFAVHCRQAPTLLIGSDCPALEPIHLQQAAKRLAAGCDAVFAPVEDGGYALVGLHRPAEFLFRAMVWSVPNVMNETRKRLRACGWVWGELETLWDVDEVADLARLRIVQPNWF